MKCKILTTTIASGVRVEAGKVYNLGQRDAEILIRMGKAQAVKGKGKLTDEKNRDAGSEDKGET